MSKYIGNNVDPGDGLACGTHSQQSPVHGQILSVAKAVRLKFFFFFKSSL